MGQHADVAAAELGRTVAVKGTGGTDHGTASAAMLFGDAFDGELEQAWRDAYAPVARTMIEAAREAGAPK